MDHNKIRARFGKLACDFADDLITTVGNDPELNRSGWTLWWLNLMPKRLCEEIGDLGHLGNQVAHLEMKTAITEREVVLLDGITSGSKAFLQHGYDTSVGMLK